MNFRESSKRMLLEHCTSKVDTNMKTAIKEGFHLLVGMKFCDEQKRRALRDHVRPRPNGKTPSAKNDCSNKARLDQQ